MVLVSYRKERYEELQDGMRKKNASAARLVNAAARTNCPVQTTLLIGSIKSKSDENEAIVGTDGSARYDKYVHNGTYDFRQDNDWTEAEAAEFTTWMSAQTRRGGSTKVVKPLGLAPRPFLVHGLIQSKEVLKGIYGRPIN